MENMTLEELKKIWAWFLFTESHKIMTVSDYKLYEKIKQAIADKEFEEKRLQF